MLRTNSNNEPFDQIDDMTEELSNIAVPRVKETRKHRFHDELKRNLLFSYEMKKRESLRASKDKFYFIKGLFRTLNHIAITAVVLPVIILGSISSYAYYSNEVYDGHLLYPVKVSIEKVEYDLAGTTSEKALTKLKFAERRLSEVKNSLVNTKTLNQKTLSLVANYTLSAVNDINHVDDDLEKIILQERMNDFSVKQMGELAMIREEASHNLLSFANTETNMNKSGASMLSLRSAGINSDSGIDEEPFLDEDKAVFSEETSEGALSESKEDVIPEAETPVAKMVEGDNYVEDDETMFDFNTTVEIPGVLTENMAEDSSLEVGAESKVSQSEEALTYVWNVTNQATQSSQQDAPVASSKSVMYSPRLQFNPDLAVYYSSDNEYLIQEETLFTFEAYPYFVDSFNNSVPSSIYSEKVEIFYTRDNSDPFSSATKAAYLSGMKFKVDRTLTLKFVAVLDNQVSPVYILRINIMPKNDVGVENGLDTMSSTVEQSR